MKKLKVVELIAQVLRADRAFMSCIRCLLEDGSVVDVPTHRCIRVGDMVSVS